MSVFYCLRTERNISLFKQRAWTCLYNVGLRSRTVVLGYEVQHYILETIYEVIAPTDLSFSFVEVWLYTFGSPTWREITLNPKRSKTRYSFSVSLPKKVQFLLRRSRHGKGNVFGTLAYHSFQKHCPCREKASLSSLLCNLLLFLQFLIH